MMNQLNHIYIGLTTLFDCLNHCLGDEQDKEQTIAIFQSRCFVALKKVCRYEVAALVPTRCI